VVHSGAKTSRPRIIGSPSTSKQKISIDGKRDQNKGCDPGMYTLPSSLKSRQFTFGAPLEKQNMLAIAAKLTMCGPPAGSYKPNHKLLETSRYHNISLGKGPAFYK
jgi:hypothetical protein